VYNSALDQINNHLVNQRTK